MVKDDSSDKHNTLVMKFGGTSVGSADAMRQVVSIISNERIKWKNIAVVTSALNGVTDQLLSMADGRVEILEAAADLRTRHEKIAAALIPEKTTRDRALAEIQNVIDEIIHLCQAVLVLGEVTPRVQDAIASAGERMCVYLLAAALEAQGS